MATGVIAVGQSDGQSTVSYKNNMASVVFIIPMIPLVGFLYGFSLSLMVFT